MKSNIKNNNLIRALNLLSAELKQDYSKEKQKIITLLVRQIKKKYRINNNEIGKLIKIRKNIEIPLQIFSEKLEALEAISTYMKENLNLSYNEIADILHRNERTIWTSYSRAVKKQKNPLKIKKTECVSISIFKEKLTILESIIICLKNKGMMYIEIARLLSRDQRNIWTIYSRAVKKEERFKNITYLT